VYISAWLFHTPTNLIWISAHGFRILIALWAGLGALNLLVCLFLAERSRGRKGKAWELKIEGASANGE
jgi:hypothetical protein